MSKETSSSFHWELTGDALQNSRNIGENIHSFLLFDAYGTSDNNRWKRHRYTQKETCYRK